MFFGFQLTLGLMMAFYGFSVMKNPRVWGDQGRRAVKAENFEEYCRQNGQFFLKAGCVVAVIGALDALVTLDALLYALLYLFGLAFAFYPLVKWCRENEGFSWPWPHVESEKKRIKKLRREQEQEQQRQEIRPAQLPRLIFNRGDRLPRNADALRQLRLRQAEPCAQRRKIFRHRLCILFSIQTQNSQWLHVIASFPKYL